MEENKELIVEKNNDELVKQISDEVVKSIKKELPRTSRGSFLSWIDIIKLGLIVLIVFIGFDFYKGLGKNKEVIAPVEDHDVTLDNNGFLGFTAADFENVILGAAEKKALLIVDEQELSVPSVIVKTGAFNWGIFSKNQSVIYYGMGQYTVDLQDIKSGDINVDDESHVITVKIPHVTLHNVFFDTTKTVFGDTEKGLLAFGDIKLTAEQNNQIEQEAVSKLTERASQEDCMKKADGFAKYVLRDFFETFTDEISHSYRVKIEFKD